MTEREEVRMIPGFWPKKVKERSCHLLRCGRLKDSKFGE